MVSLPRSIRDEMAAHAIEGYPYEVCGLLAGRAGVVTRLFRARNKERSPVRYSVEDADLLRIFREIDDADLELVGIYHSHVHTLAFPSATDIRQATYPDALYFIVSLLDERPPHVRAAGGIRAFRIRDGEVSEEPIDIEEPGTGNQPDMSS